MIRWKDFAKTSFGCCARCGSRPRSDSELAMRRARRSRSTPHEIAVVSAERIGAEMRRVLVSEHAVTGLRHLIDCGLERVGAAGDRFGRF